MPNPGQGDPAWRAKRDRVIRTVYAAGLPQRLLADVFDLSRARIHAILSESESERTDGACPETQRRPMD